MLKSHIKCVESVYVQVHKLLSGGLSCDDNELVFCWSLAVFAVLLHVLKSAQRFLLVTLSFCVCFVMIISVIS